jgi:hypothetical protein
MAERAKPRPPWRRKPSAASRRRGARKLTPAEKERARERAARAGRRYPNLVDNMWVLRQRRKRNEPE